MPGQASSDEHPLAFELPAVAESVPLARARFADWADGLGLSDDRLHALKLALTEAVNNAVVHAYRDRESGPFRVQAELADGRVTLAVEDFGMGMRPRVDSPGLGMGLPLISNLVSRVSIICMPERDAGTEVRMVC
jgi:serine/threonine-protein kinase RsbW